MVGRRRNRPDQQPEKMKGTHIQGQALESKGVASFAAPKCGEFNLADRYTKKDVEKIPSQRLY
jgi:hypothetical protein